jgi:hypothetical protein
LTLRSFGFWKGSASLPKIPVSSINVMVFELFHEVDRRQSHDIAFNGRDWSRTDGFVEGKARLETPKRSHLEPALLFYGI